MDKKGVTVYTSGSWDLFHVGHLNIIRRSQAYGDRLIVGVSTDELVEAYKGTKPIIPYDERVAIVRAIGGVDKVVKQTILTDIRLLKRHKIDVVTIGDDWRNKHLDGLEWMKEHGRVVYMKYTPGVSTTGIKRKIIKSAYELIYAELKREIQAGDRWVRRQESGSGDQ